MADFESEAEWAKQKRIEEERMKAVRAMENAKPDMAGLAELGPQKNKVRGWSSDENLLMEKAEKFGTWSAILAPAGIVMTIISDVGGAVGSVNKLGMASVIISGIPGGIGVIGLGLAMVFGLIGLIVAIYYKARRGRKFGVAGWSGAASILLVGGYMMIRNLIFGM